MSNIQFFKEEVEFELMHQQVVSDWITSVIQSENQSISAINYIFCSDPYLHQINVDYLQHDTFTDIITFPYSYSPIEADLFISIDRVRENANIYQTTFEKELLRVIIHGVLHLLGFDDKNQEQQLTMRQKENELVEKYYELFR